MLEYRGRIETNRLREVFDRLDCDQTGRITKANLKEVLSSKDSGLHTPDSLVDEIFDELDTGTSGAVTFEEFSNLFATKTKQEALDAVCCPSSPKTTVNNNMQQQKDKDSSSDVVADLVGVDAIIPGGKYDSPIPPKHVYDPKTKSMRKYDSASDSVRC